MKYLFLHRPGLLTIFLFAFLIICLPLGPLAVVPLLPLLATLTMFVMNSLKGMQDRAPTTGRLTMANGHPAPAFLTANASVFGKKFCIEFSSGGQSVVTWARPLRPHSKRDVSKALGLIENAAIIERLRRGLRVKDEANALIRPRLTEQGYVVETQEGDDGSVQAIVAFDIAQMATREDYARGQELRIVGFHKDWEGTVVRPTTSPAHDGAVPLGLPALKHVELAAADPVSNPFRPLSTEKGAAQFAWADEMRGGDAIAFIDFHDLDFENPFPAPGAALGIFNAADWQDANGGPLGAVFAKGEGHRIVVGPPGSGKFTAAFAPLLLTADTASAFVFDVANGEAARVTAPWRAKLGPVLVIDPFGVSGLESGALNPLDFIRADDPDVLQAAKRLTDALFIAPPGDSKDEYFNEQARDVLTAYLLHVATGLLETDRTLRRVRELIRRPITPDLIVAMENNTIAAGFVADMAANLLEADNSGAERNTFYVTQTLRANTAFLDLPAVLTATERTTLDPRILRQQISTLYICLPEAQLGLVGRWLRLVYATVMEQVRERTAVPLHVLIDEFPALGHFSRIKDDMALVRKFGIHIHIATQSLTQLEGIYGKDWQSFMAAAKYQQLLGANDHMTAEYFSSRLGKTTRRGTSTSQSRSSSGGSEGTSTGWEASDLMAPDELGRMHPDEVITVVEGMNPVRLRKLRYHLVETLMERTGQAAPAAT